MDDEYFSSYDDLEVHRVMLSDKSRVNAYRNAIFNNIEKFNGAVVLDLGAGTGFLSVLAAKAGASKVFAVEAAPQMIEILKGTVAENNMGDIIQIIEGPIESVCIPQRADILISEFMGFYLLHEGMLDSFIFAKKFLKKTGIIIPDKCRIWAALCKLPMYFSFWDDIEGVKMCSVGEKFRKQISCKPEILAVDSSDIISEPRMLFELDLNESWALKLDVMSTKSLITSNFKSPCHGLTIWFDVDLLGETFTTSPFSPVTHWKQAVIILPDEIELDEKEPFAFEIEFVKQSPRRYDIELVILDPDDIPHSNDCDCYLTKCILTRAVLANKS